MKWNHTKLLLLLKEGTVEGVGGGIVEKLEAVKDLDGAPPLDPYDATVDSRGLLMMFNAVGVVINDGGGGRGGCEGRVHLGLDTSVVIRYVYDYEGMQLEG